MHSSKLYGAVFFLVPAALGCSSRPVDSTGGPVDHASGASLSAGSKSYATASALTWPGATCAIHSSTTTDSTKSLTVVADDVGVALFAAIKAAPGEPDSQLTLDCHDDTGRAESYTADLTAASTFQRTPPGAPTPVMTRPALEGDPTKYTQEYLLSHSYGVRPDPVKNPRSYALWLDGATRSGRLAKTPATHPEFPANAGYTVTDQNNQGWGGGVLTGGNTYEIAVWELTVPTGGVPEPNSFTGLWGGLGGVGGHNDLIQDGVQIQISSNVASYSTWIQYASGGSCPFGYGGTCLGYNSPFYQFNVAAGDKVLGEVWACDSGGNVNLSGGYGCFLLEDVTGSTQIADCNKPPNPNGPFNPCSSLPAVNTFVGATAEAIIERRSDSGQLADYGSTNITLDALDSTDTERNYSNTNATQLTLVNGSDQILEEVATDLSSPDGTSFVWEQGT